MERIPPQDLDAEMALLGSMMMSRDAIAEVVPVISRSTSHWLYRPDHQKLFEVLLDLFDDPTKAIDLVVVADELRRRDMLEDVGGYEHMIQLAESFADWANAEHYARIVRDKGMLRDLIRCTGEIADSAYTGAEEAKDILDRAEQHIFEVTSHRVGGRTAHLKEALGRVIARLDDHDGGGLTGLASGLHGLDELTSGFQAGDLIVVAARPSMGKTALGLGMAAHAAFHERKAVIFFSMEMSADQLAQRIICAHAGVDAQKLRRRRTNEEENRDLLNACAELSDSPLYVDDTPGMTATEVRSAARRIAKRHEIKAVYIDYLQLMHWPGAESRQIEVSNISRSLKALGRELNVPIIAMAQLNRMAEGRADKRPQMSDLRESGAIEQDADVVLLIHREEYYHPEKEELRGQAELIIAKQRNGPTGIVELHFNKNLTRFTGRHVGAHYEEAARPADAPF